MPLINFQTDLTNLPWGRDRRDGGSSNQPYITKDIPKGLESDDLPLRSGPDFIIRGGLKSITNSLKDVSRLAQMFFDFKTPAGLLFIAKQNILSRNSVKTQASAGIGYGGARDIIYTNPSDGVLMGGGGPVNQGIYTPLSTLGQALGGFAGLHLNQLGIDPTSPMSGVVQGSLGDIFGINLGLNTYDSVVNPRTSPELNDNPNLNRLVTLNTFHTGDFDQNKVNLISYSGGPGSILGIGKTHIRFADQRTGNSAKFQQLNNSKTFSSLQILNQDNIIKGSATALYPTDFRKKLYGTTPNPILPSDNPKSTVLSLSPSYRDKNLDVRLEMGQPGRQGGQRRSDPGVNRLIKNIWNYGIDAVELEALDKITASPMYSGSSPDIEGQALNDSVKFRIAAINNDNTNGEAVYMHFRAFLDDFSDSYTATWNPVDYVGRGESLYNYNKFGRTVSLAFTVAAQSKAELIPMYKKLNYLASTLAPDYSGAGFMRGNMVRLTIGGYLYEQPGFITALTYTVPQESTWEIAINEEGESDSSVKELPHMIKVTGFSFTPIHNFLPQKPEDANNPNSKFIALNNGVNNNYDAVYDSYRPARSEIEPVSTLEPEPVEPLDSLWTDALRTPSPPMSF